MSSYNSELGEKGRFFKATDKKAAARFSSQSMTLSQEIEILLPAVRNLPCDWGVILTQKYLQLAAYVHLRSI